MPSHNSSEILHSSPKERLRFDCNPSYWYTNQNSNSTISYKYLDSVWRNLFKIWLVFGCSIQIDGEFYLESKFKWTYLFLRSNSILTKLIQYSIYIRVILGPENQEKIASPSKTHRWPKSSSALVVSCMLWSLYSNSSCVWHISFQKNKPTCVQENSCMFIGWIFQGTHDSIIYRISQENKKIVLHVLCI